MRSSLWHSVWNTKKWRLLVRDLPTALCPKRFLTWPSPDTTFDFQMWQHKTFTRKKNMSSSFESSLVINHFLGSILKVPCDDLPLVCNTRDLGLIPGLGRSTGEGKGYPLQYSGLENSMDGTVHGVIKSWTWLSNFHFFLFTAAPGSGQFSQLSHQSKPYTQRWFLPYKHLYIRLCLLCRFTEREASQWGWSPLCFNFYRPRDEWKSLASGHKGPGSPKKGCLNCQLCLWTW